MQGRFFEMALRASGVLTTLCALVFAAAGPAVSATPPVPAPPSNLNAVAGVDGVRLSWARGSYDADSAPTSYVVHRHAPSGDQDWEVTAAVTGGSTQDTTLPAGADATYTVSARNAAGDSAESSAVVATRLRWDGPYTAAHRTLTVVWDRALDVAGPGGSLTRSAQVTDSSTPPLAQVVDNGLTGFTDQPASSYSGPAFDVQPGLTDGDYVVGPGGIGALVFAGVRCPDPEGTAKVWHAGPSMNGGYLAISLDATLHCGTRTATVHLRWNTPEDNVNVTAPELDVAEAGPGTTTATVVPVRNTGGVPIRMAGARLVAAWASTSDPLAIIDNACAGQTLAPGGGCAITVQYTAGTPTTREGNASVVLDSDQGEWDLTRVVGQLPARFSGPQNVATDTSPGRIDVTWGNPWTLDSALVDHWRVDDLTAGTQRIVATQSWGAPQKTQLTGLSVGTHEIQVVMVTTDGREVKAAPVSVDMARRWLLVNDLSGGVRAINPDVGGSGAGLLPYSGFSGQPTLSVATSANRREYVTTEVRSGVPSLTVRDLVGHARPVTTDVAMESPEISPDGRTVIVSRGTAVASDGSTTPSALLTMPIAGGPLSTVPASQGLASPKWTPDGLSVVASQPGGSLTRVNVATGARTALMGTQGAFGPAVSRTGSVAYLLQGGSGLEVRITGANGGSSRLLGTLAGSLSSLAWDPTGRWLAASGGWWNSTSVFDTMASPALVRTMPYGGDGPAWLDVNSAAPTATLSGAAWTTTSPTLTVGASDADDASGGLARECRLDGGAWSPCGPTWALTGLAAGSHTAEARVTDPSGAISTLATHNWSVDSLAPAASLAPVVAPLLSTATTLAWSGTDSGGSGPSRYDVRYRTAPIGGALGSYAQPASWQNVAARSVSATLAQGAQYCFSVRARDVAGNVGAWSTERCTWVALDDRGLALAGVWTRGSSAGYSYGTWTKATRAGVSLVRNAVQARRVGVVATTCATCGSVTVYHAGVRLGTISLYSATTRTRQVKWLPLQSVTRTGPVRITTLSSRAVIIDGLVVAH
jgi:hypothetical protein